MRQDIQEEYGSDIWKRIPKDKFWKTNTTETSKRRMQNRYPEDKSGRLIQMKIAEAISGKYIRKTNADEEC